jgi:hypothetical protein
MSSFTDNPQVNFNPYIQQLPVKEMVGVGMELQKRYDTGVEKIQSSIDRIAGLDIIRDVDKQYLHSKLNELGTKLKTVAAGDFSNYQLTNHVAGMAGSIGKDNNVINAVTSTARVRSGQKDLEVAKKEGKSSVQNEDWWNYQVGNYLNNKDLKTSFNGEYVPYLDLTEKYAKVAKDVEAIEYTYDQPYQTNADGSLKYFTKDNKGRIIETDKDKGQPMIDDAMKTITRKGKAAQTILNNFMDNTTENDRRQLQIDAAYHYKNANADNFKGDIKNVFDLQKRQLEEYSTELGVLLKNPKIPDKDKALMQAKLNEVNLTLTSGKLDGEMMRYLEDLKDPSKLADFKTRLYTQKYLTNLAQDKSTESYIMSLKSNPYTQMDMEKKRFMFDIEKENNRIKEKNRDYQFEYLKWITEQQKNKDPNTPPITVPGGVSTEVERPTGLTISNKLDQINKALETNDKAFLNKNKKYTQDQLNEFASKYDGNPTSVDTKDNELREYLRQRRDLEITKLRTGNLQRKLAEVTAPIDAELDSKFNTETGVYDNSGREIYSSKDLYSFWNERKKYLSFSSSGQFGGGKMNLDVEGLLKKYKGTKYEDLAIATVNTWRGNASTIDKQLEEKGYSVYSKFNTEVVDNYTKKLNAESEYLTTKTNEYMTMEGTLSNSNKVDMNIADQLIANSIANPIGMIDVNRKSEFNATTITSWREDPKIKGNLDYRLIKNSDGSGTFVIQHGSDKQIIPLTASYMSTYYPQYAGISSINTMKDAIMSSPEFTTNPISKGNPTSALYTGYAIPNLRDTEWASRVRFDVEGSFRNIGSPEDDYQIRVYVIDDKGLWHDEIINQTGFIKEGRIMEAVEGIGTEVIMQILNK